MKLLKNALGLKNAALCGAKPSLGRNIVINFFSFSIKS